MPKGLPARPCFRDRRHHVPAVNQLPGPRPLNVMKRFVALAILMLWTIAALALPTVEAVQAEVRAGHYTQAESMLREVVAARPDSAKAHYLYAEMLAHNRRFGAAAQEARLAKQIDPAVRFTQPEKFTAFEQLLEREQRADTSASRASVVQHAQPLAERGGVPGWIWGAGGAAIAFLLWRLFGARKNVGVGPAGFGTGGVMGAPAATASSPAYTPGYPAGSTPAPAAGSGMLGTGLAVAGGLAAGMLAERLFEGHHERGLSGGAIGGSDALAPGMFGGGTSRNEAADELENRSIDFGNGDDWGGDDGGGMDAGGG